MIQARGFALGAMLFLGAGCVPLTDYQKLEDRLKENEQYVLKHKEEKKELQKREQFLVLQAKEREKDMELLRARLAKSEHLRSQLEAQGKTKLVVTEQPASVKPDQTNAFGGFKINSDTGGIVLDHDILFASGESNLKSSGKHVLEELVSKLNSSEFCRYIIRVDGHTDDAPVVKTKKENHDNWELGAKRAKVVLEYMISKGIAPERCFFASFGPYRPLMKDSGIKEMVKEEKPEKFEKPVKGKKHPQHTTKKPATCTEGQAQNRRVEIVLFEK
jgi:flagellar motor protein MotB